MIGLAYLVVAIIYLLILIVVVSEAWRKGRKTSRKRAWSYATLGFLAVYLPLFWDYLPTLAMHQYYCAKDAGIITYKTPEQWIKEHAGELDQLRIDNAKERITAIQTSDGWTRRFLNRKVAYDVRNNKDESGLFFISSGEARYIDIERNELLSLRNNYSSGQRGFESGSLRFWMNFGGCEIKSDSSFYSSYDKYLLGVKK